MDSKHEIRLTINIYFCDNITGFFFKTNIRDITGNLIKYLLYAFKSGDRTDVLILFRLHNKLIRGEKKVAAKLISSCMYLSSQTPIPRRGRTQGLGGSRPSPGPWGDIPERRHRQMPHLQTEKFEEDFIFQSKATLLRQV